MKSVIRNQFEALRFIDRACNDLGQQFEHPQLIEIKRYKPPRSLPQNAKFHAMIGELAKEIGYSSGELKSWFKGEYGPKQFFILLGKECLIPRSTASYNKAEMNEMIGHIERIGAELGFQFSDGEV